MQNCTEIDLGAREHNAPPTKPRLASSIERIFRKFFTSNNELFTFNKVAFRCKFVGDFVCSFITEFNWLFCVGGGF